MTMKLAVFLVLLIAMVEAGVSCLLVWGFMNLIGTMVGAGRVDRDVAFLRHERRGGRLIRQVPPGTVDRETVGPTDPVSEVIFQEITDNLREGPR